MWCMATLTIVEMLIIVVMTFRAGLQREFQGAKILTSMFGVTAGTGNTGFTMCRNNRSSEGFCLMARGAICVHLFFICHTHSYSVAGSA